MQFSWAARLDKLPHSSRIIIAAIDLLPIRYSLEWKILGLGPRRLKQRLVEVDAPDASIKPSEQD
jgi:hypothetical protein